MKKVTKRLISIILCVLLCISVVPVTQVSFSASAAEEIPVVESEMLTDGYYTYVVVEGTAVLQKASAELSGDIVIPEKLGGYTVTTIQMAAFMGNQNITGVTIPGTVKVIGPAAFYGCTALKTVVMQNGVESITNAEDEKMAAALLPLMEGMSFLEMLVFAVLAEYGAFQGCTSLESVAIPASVSDIGYNTFNGCSSLATINFPEGVTVGEKALDGTAWYNNQPDGIIYIYNSFYAYKGTAPENTSVTVKDGVTSIPANAFYNQTGIVSITLPSSLTSIGDYAFYGCTGLASIEIPSGVTSIGDYAFYGCTGLASIEIPSGVTSIGNHAFQNCTGLASIELPSSVTSIGENAFYYCSALANVTMSENVTSVGANAFYGTPWYSSLADGPVYFGKVFYAYKGTMPENTELTIKDGTVTIAANALYAGYSGDYALVKVTIPESVTTIGTQAFYNRKGLTAVDLPDNIEYMGDYAFAGCSGLTEIYIPGTWTMDGYYVFQNCTGLKKATIGEGMYGTGVGTFYNCTALEEVVLPSTETELGTYAFRGCTSLKKINLPDGLVQISNYTFYGCSALESLDIPESVTTIREYAFYGCTALADVEIPAGVTTIGNYAFYNCKALTGVTIPSGVTSIEPYTFYGSGLTEITVPETVQKIGNYAFYGCESLKTAKILADIDAIDVYTFANCTALESVELPESLYAIGREAFCNCSSLKSITIPEKTFAIDTKAFYNCTSLAEISVPVGCFTGGGQVFHETAWYANQPDGPIYINDTFYSYKGDIAEKSFTIKDGTTALAGYAFAYQPNIETVVIPDSVVKAGVQVFEGSSVKYITLPENLRSEFTVDIDGTETPVYLNARMFSNCTSLETVVLPEKLEKISEEMFYGCTSLKTCAIPESVNTISSNAFYNCKSLTELDLPDDIENIGSYAFAGCSGLTEVYIPGTWTFDGNYIFKDCTGLKKATLGEGLYGTGYGVFSGCTALEEVVLPSTETHLGYNAFYNCKNLKKINLPEGVVQIGESTFEGCGFTEISLPKSLETVGYSGFYGCENLTDVYYAGTEADWENISISSSNEPLLNATIHFTYLDAATCAHANTKELEATDPTCTKPGSTGGTKCLDCGTMISEGGAIIPALNHKNAVEKPQVDATCQSPGTTAGTYCPDCETWLSGGEQINYADCKDEDYDNYCDVCGYYYYRSEYDYGYCGDDLYYTIYTDGTVIIEGEGAMYDYDGDISGDNPSPFTYAEVVGGQKISKVIVREDATTIGAFAFANCVELESVDLPETLTSIGAGAFGMCMSLEAIDIPENVTTIGMMAFYTCAGAETVTIPESVTSVGANAFSDIPYLENAYVYSKTLDLEGSGLCLTSETSTLSKAEYVELGVSIAKLMYSGADENDEEYVELRQKYESTCTTHETPVAAGTINGYRASAAETYANKYGITFKALDCAHENTTEHAAVGATCTEIGYTAGTYCADCEKWISGHEEIYATNHKNAVNEAAIAATCQKGGREAGKYCPDCETWVSGGTETGKVGHKMGSWYKVKDPTCTAEGQNKRECTFGCGHSETAPIAATNHKNAVDKAAIAATCSSTGRQAGKYCPDCKIWVSGGAEIPVTDHIDENPYDGYCDTCGAETKAQQECGCNCHKGGFMGFIWNILKFFFKIFRTNEQCACGVIHY